MFYVGIFQLFFTFVSYKHKLVAKKVDFFVVSGRDECMSHSGAKKILVFYVLCRYLPAILDFCVVQLQFDGKS